MKVLVTGSTGLLGNNLVRKLVEAGHDVRCPVRSLNPESLAGLELEQVAASFLPGEDSWTELLTGCDAVIHCAAIIHLGWTRFEECRRINVQTTEEIATAARQTQAKMIHVSSVDTLPHAHDGTPLSESSTGEDCPPCNYVVTKSEAEQVVHAAMQEGLDATIVHPGFLIGGWDWKPSSGKLLLAISRKQIPFAPAGGCCAVDVLDVVHGLIQCLTQAKSGEHYILGGHNTLYYDLFQQMQAVVGGRAPRFVLRPGMASVGGWIGDTVTKVIGRETDFNSAMIQMGQLKHFYDSSKAIQQLGYRISPLSPAIERAWSFIQKHHL